MRFIFCLLLFFMLLTQSAQSQEWVNKMSSGGQKDFFEIQRTFESYWKDKKIEKGKGYKAYKRWEWFWKPRVDAQGKFPSPEVRLKALEYSLAHHLPNPASRQGSPTNPDGQLGLGVQSVGWTCLGPFTSPGGYTGNGRLNVIGFHPTLPGNYYVGAPAGGLWHTTDDGLTWTTTTDQLPSLGVSGLVVDWSNPQVVYLGSGDGDGSDTHSLGVWKSTDGGLTWNPTGLSWNPGQSYQINRLIQDPINSAVLMAATSDGIYRTTDGGQTWTQVETTGARDIEMKPGDPNTWYASTYRDANDVRVLSTTDAGATWTTVYTNTNSNRINIAVSPANPTLVALLCSEDGSNGLEGIYTSYTSGSSGSFTQVFSGTTANLLDYSDDGSGSGGQGWYDLAFDIDPNNANIFYTGGINLWKSTDAGLSWTCKSMWYQFTGLAEVHADQHFLAFQPNRPSHLFACNDGGLFVSTDGGDSWTELTHLQQGPVIGQYYRLSNAFYNPHVILGGLQDNGSKLLRNGQWVEATGGDGMECIIDPVDSTIMYGSYVNGSISRSNDGGQTFATYISGNLPNPDNGAWVTPYCLDPADHNTLYIAYDEVYKSTDNGDNFITISNGIPTGTNMDFLEVCIASSSRIYTGHYDEVYRTTNGGQFWTNITPSPHTGSFTSITSDPLNENRIWLANSSWTAGTTRVYYSSNGGLSWTDYSGTLPDVPVNTIIYQRGTQDGLYIGTDIGVYYRDNSLGDWVYYNNGLPVVVVSELEIHYGSGNLRAATYGRGVWESPLYVSSNPAAPSTDFTSSVNTVCAGYPVNFTDLSGNNPTQWNWTLPGSSSPYSTIQNPTVTYSTPGTYQVSLITSNANGSSFAVKNSWIIVQYAPTATAIYTGSPCAGDSIQFIGTVLSGATYSWTGPNGFNASTSNPWLAPLSLNQTGAYSYTVQYQGCSSIPAVVNLSVIPLPLAPINVAGTNPLCQGNSLNLSCSFSGGGTPIWQGPGGFNSTLQNPVIANPTSGIYTVYIDNLGCTSPEVQLSIVVFPTPAKPVITQNGNLLTSSALSGNQWYRYTGLLPGETSQVLDISPYGSGDYTVQETTQNGCISPESDLINILFTSTESEAMERRIKIFPNPTNGILTIESNASNERIDKILFYSSEGKLLLKRQEKSGKKVSLDLSEFPAGNYQIEVVTELGAHYKSGIIRK